MEEEDLIRVLDKVMWYTKRNRPDELKKYIDQELDNINGVTEIKCRRRKVNVGYCNRCANYNCNLNRCKPPLNMSRSDRIALLSELKFNIDIDNVDAMKSNLRAIKEQCRDTTMIEILSSLENLLERNDLFMYREYLQLMIDNFNR